MTYKDLIRVFLDLENVTMSLSALNFPASRKRCKDNLDRVLNVPDDSQIGNWFEHKDTQSSYTADAVTKSGG
jgi:hypothetical protein